jgi:putative spermidine/putrescine transport system permease protein
VATIAAPGVAPAAASVARRGDGVEWQLAGPLGLVYLLFFAAPLLLLVAISFYHDADLTRITGSQWVKFFSDPFYLSVIGRTLQLGAVTVLATTVLSFPLALVFCASRPSVQKLLLLIIIMPLLTSVVVRTFAWIVILAREGVINQAILTLGLSASPLPLLQTEFGLVLALTQIEMPLMLLPLITVMRTIDPNVVDASRALGASRWRTFFQVILPLSLPGWVAGATLVFASSVTAFISQSVIGGGRLVFLPSVIWQQSMVVYNWPFAAVAAVTLLVTVLAGIGLLAAAGTRLARR